MPFILDTGAAVSLFPLSLANELDLRFGESDNSPHAKPHTLSGQLEGVMGEIHVNFMTRDLVIPCFFYATSASPSRSPSPRQHVGRRHRIDSRRQRSSSLDAWLFEAEHETDDRMDSHGPCVLGRLGFLNRYKVEINQLECIVSDSSPEYISPNTIESRVADTISSALAGVGRAARIVSSIFRSITIPARFGEHRAAPTAKSRHPAIVEVYLTTKLSDRDLAGFHLHCADILDRGDATGVQWVGHRIECGGTVLRFEAGTLDSIYAALPALMAAFPLFEAVAWERCLERIPAKERGKALEFLTQLECRRRNGRWRVADILGKTFDRFRNARVYRIAEGRRRGFRLDLFTDEDTAGRLLLASSGASSLALTQRDTIIIAGDYHMGDNVNNHGIVVGSALGTRASVTAEQIAAVVSQRLERPGLGEEVVDAIRRALGEVRKTGLPERDSKDAIEAVGQIEEEMRQSTPSAPRLQRWLSALAGVCKPAAEILGSAHAIAKLTSPDK